MASQIILFVIGVSLIDITFHMRYVTYLDTTSLTHASDDDHDKRNTNKKTKKTIKSEKNAFHPIGECASDPEHISSCLVVNLAEESDNSFPSDPGSSPDQWNKKRSNKMRKTIIGECTNERNANKLEMCRGKSSKTDHRNQLISEKFKRDQRKEGTRCAAVGACSANDFKKSSKAASFFMSKVRTLVIHTCDELLIVVSLSKRLILDQLM